MVMVNALETHNLVKTYPNGVPALQKVDLSVAAGDFFALLGPNGAGKSTLIGIISSLVNKTSGQVRIFGHDLEGELEAAKSCLGVVPQEFNCNGFETVYNTLIWQAGYYGMTRAQAAINSTLYLKRLGLWDKRDDIVRNLSGGMKRRLMIARALVHQPRLLILDEPTAGVDIEVRRSLWDFLREINQQGITIILTTHYLEEAESLCRNIAIIDHGRIVEHTSMRELLATLELETFILYLRQPLRQAPPPGPYRLRQVDDWTLEADLADDQDLNGLFEYLQAQHVEVKSMRNKANRLEQLFLNLVERGQLERQALNGQVAPV